MAKKIRRKTLNILQLDVAMEKLISGALGFRQKKEYLQHHIFFTHVVVTLFSPRGRQLRQGRLSEEKQIFVADVVGVTELAESGTEGLQLVFRDGNLRSRSSRGSRGEGGRLI